MGEKSDAKGSTTWRKIADKVKTRMVRHEKRKKRRAVKSFDKDNSIAKKGADAATAFLWNYNSVEGILLSCAVFINLSGIMFQAFADCGRDIPGYYDPQKKLLTYVTIITVIMSFVYFGAVFGCEVIITINPPCIRGKEFNWKFWKKDKSKAEIARKKKLGIEDDDELDLSAGPLSLKSNPLMSGASVIKGDARVKAGDLPDDPPTVDSWHKVKRDYKSVEDEVAASQDALADLRSKINELKKSAALDKDSTAGKSAATRRSISVKKREFGARSAKRQLPRGKSAAKLKTSASKSNMDTTKGRPVATEKEVVMKGDWVEVRDASTGKPYYHNRVTGEVTWSQPTEFNNT